MVIFGYKTPTNKLVAYAQNEIAMQELYAGVANIKPGMLVGRVTDDSKCTIATIGTSGVVPYGVAGYEQSFLGSTSYTSQRPSAITSAYASGAFVPILSGTNFVLSLQLAANFATVKGDRLCSFTSGTVAPYVSAQGGFALKIPFTNSEAAEVDTGIDLPAGVMVTGAFVEVTTAVADGTIDVGLLSTEASGDADGFLNGVSCATAGFIMPINQAAVAATLTAGELISTAIKSADSTAIFFAFPKTHVTYGTAKSITYTTADKKIAGNIYLVCQAKGMIDVGRAEKTVATSTSVQNVMSMVNI